MFRLDPRLKLRLPIEVTPRWDGGEPVVLEAVDLSITGTACRGPVHLPLRTQVGVRLNLPSARAGDGSAAVSLVCEAVVVNIERIGRTRFEWRTGLYFLDLRGEVREALRRFIYDTIRSQQEATMVTRGKAGSVVFAAALGLAAALAWPATGRAYTVITRDGHRIETRSKPEIKGESAFMRLLPGGQLAVIPQEKVDWSATERANPAPSMIAVPADAMLADSVPEAAPVRIKGTAGRREASPGAAGEAKPDGAIAGKPTTPSTEEGKEALVKLQKEYSYLLAQKDQLSASRQSHEKELAGLESTDAAQAGIENATTRRIRVLKDQVAAESAQIQKLEVRMNDIRVEAVGLGGTID